MSASARIAVNVHKAVLAILNASSLATSKGGYIKNIYDGVRDNIPENGFPCVAIEPGVIEERTATADGTRKKHYVYTVRIKVYMQCVNYDKQIAGDPPGTPNRSVGLLDIVNDVENEIDKYPQLDYDSTGPRCTMFLFPKVDPDNQLFPFRTAEIHLQTTTLTAGTASR